MGSTDSKVAMHNFQSGFRPIRRFTSQLYNNYEITIMEDKSSNLQWAFREVILQGQSSRLKQQIHCRQSLHHRNLIQMTSFQVERDMHLCSNLYRINLTYEYIENSLEDIIEDKISKHQKFQDWEIVDFIKQLISALSFMQKHKIGILINGGKTIGVSEVSSEVQMQSRFKNRKQNKSQSRQRLSLIDLKINSRNESICSQSRRIFKLFSDLQATNSHCILNPSNQMHVPLHPQITAHYESLTEAQANLQNSLTIVLLSLSMCTLCDVWQLPIFKKQRVSIEKIKNLIHQSSHTFPRSTQLLLKMICSKGFRFELNPLRQITDNNIQNISKTSIYGQKLMDKLQNSLKSDYKSKKLNRTLSGMQLSERSLSSGFIIPIQKIKSNSNTRLR